MTNRFKYKPRLQTLEVLLHDSHTKPDVISSRDVKRWEALAERGARRMGLLSTGYHAIGERDGHVTICRGLDLIGAHCPGGGNLDSIGYCLVGGRDENGNAVDNFTLIQWQCLFAFCVMAEDRYGPLRITSHSERQTFRNKKLPPCPPVDMQDVRRRYKIYKENLDA